MAFKEKVVSVFNKTKRTLIHYEPEIEMAGSVVLGVGAIFFAIKGTMGVKTVIDDHMDRMELVKNVHENGLQVIDPDTEDVYTEKDYRHDLFITYKKTGIELVKLYWPMMLCEAGSVALRLRSHSVMKNRYANLLSDYITISEAYKAYRQRVADKYGEEAEQKLYLNAKEEKEEVLDENGKKKTEKHYITDTDQVDSFYFDALTTSNYSTNDEVNEMFFAKVITYADKKLSQDGHLWKNDFLTLFNVEHQDDGYRRGYHFDSKKDGADKIKNAIKITKMERRVDRSLMPSGYIPTYRIDLNCDGNIEAMVYEHDKELNHIRHLNMIGYDYPKAGIGDPFR